LFKYIVQYIPYKINTGLWAGIHRLQYDRVRSNRIRPIRIDLISRMNRTYTKAVILSEGMHQSVHPEVKDPIIIKEIPRCRLRLRFELLRPTPAGAGLAMTR